MWSSSSNVPYYWNSKSNTHPGFIKARPQYSHQSPWCTISTGDMVAFGSPSSDSLAEDCRLIIPRRHWHLLNALTNVHERKASCFLNNEWFETLIQSSSSIRLRRRGKFLSLLLAKTVKKLQRPLNCESASATCKCHGGDAKSTTIFVWFWHRFFYFFLFFSLKLRGRVTRKKSTLVHRPSVEKSFL